MNKRYLVSKILLADGIVLITLGFVHLVSTPLAGKWLSGQLTEAVMRDISHTYFLEHVTVGILLISFGVSTLFSAVGVRAGQFWARSIALTNGLTILLLPLLVVLIMGSRYFDSPVYLVAAVVVVMIGLSMLLPLLWLRDSNRPGATHHSPPHVP